jgi:hypothetical protein
MLLVDSLKTHGISNKDAFPIPEMHPIVEDGRTVLN